MSGRTEWFSYDIDTGDVVAKTRINDDGSINRYEYTKPDNIREGHGDTVYDTYEDFVNDNPNKDLSRDKNDEASIYRYWAGNGFDLGINELLSNNEINNNYYSINDLLNYNTKKLVLKHK